MLAPRDLRRAKGLVSEGGKKGESAPRGAAPPASLAASLANAAEPASLAAPLAATTLAASLAASLAATALGCRDPTQAHDPDTNPYQRGDGVFGNWAGSARPVVYDGTCVTAVHHGRLRPLANGTHLATDYAEATKRKANAACGVRRQKLRLYDVGGEHARRHRARGSDVVQLQLRHQGC